MKATGYVRVSLAKQAEEGVSLEAQEAPAQSVVRAATATGATGTTSISMTSPSPCFSRATKSGTVDTPASVWDDLAHERTWRLVPMR